MKRFKIGDRVVVLDNFNTTAKGKVGTIVANRGIGHVVGFFCEGVMTNYELEDYIVRYPGLKATWWLDSRELELANTFTNNRFR